jgi:hypothetical protein
MARDLVARGELIQYLKYEQVRSQRYPKLRVIQQMVAQGDDEEALSRLHNDVRLSKGRRKQHIVIDVLQRANRLFSGAKEDAFPTQSVKFNSTGPMQESVRERALLLYRGLTTHWRCVCETCDQLGIRLAVYRGSPGPDTGLSGKKA